MKAPGAERKIRSPVKCQEAAAVVFRRRKAGEDSSKNPVRITLESLRPYFNGPLTHAASSMGICATALKKVCRKLGIEKWPYKDNKPAVTMPAIKKSSLDKPWLQTVGDLPLPGIDKNMEKFGQEMGCESGKAAILAPIQMISLEHQRQEHSNSAAASQADAEYGEEDITIYPRSARSGGCDGPKSPVRITRDILTENFNMPLHAAADHMGICITALKKVCRKFGIQKWPYRDSMLQGAKLDVDAPALHHHIAKAKVPRSALASLADAACSSADSEERSSSHDESEACEGKCSIAALLMASESILGQSVLG